MITIISGPINSGKTKILNEIYIKNNKGDGFVCEKYFHQGVFCGYNLRQLSTNQTRNFIYLTDQNPPLQSTWKFKKFTFDREVLQWAESVYMNLIIKKIDPLYLDEIGPVELENKGFWKIFNKILSSQLDLYFTTRGPILDDVVKKFRIQKFNLIKIQQQLPR